MHSKILQPANIFECKRCGDCCKGYGGTYVTKNEIDSIASYIHADPETFIDKYCQLSGSMPVLAQGKSSYCIFWDGQCTIHPVKPRMCRTWPFIESVRVDINNWHIMASLCPGIRIDVSDSVVQGCVSRTLAQDLEQFSK